MDIFAAKIRAGRGIARLSIEALAERAGVNREAVRRLEAEETSPNSRTQAKLMRALEEAGVKFTDKGVEVDDSSILILHGDSPEECYLKLLNDVFLEIKKNPKIELLISNADDKVSPPAVNDMYRQIRSAGVKMRQLVEEGNTYLMGGLEEYRYIPQKYFINRVTLIYGNKVATLTDDENTISVNKDPINADTRRNLFDFMWDKSEQPTETTADERF